MTKTGKLRTLVAVLALMAGTGGSLILAGGSAASAASALATASGSGHPWF